MMGRAEPTARAGARALRSDAAANRDRVLAAAAVAVHREGLKVPLATVAEDAGVGVGTLYRHYPTRAALLSALADRSYRLVLDLARQAARNDEAAIASIGAFLDQVIGRRADLVVLPLHGGPVIQDDNTTALQAEIRESLDEILRRGQADGTIRGDVTSQDIIIMGALLAQPLSNMPHWDRVAGRQARIYLDGLRPTAAAIAGA